MMLKAFTADSPYTKRARIIAVAWTLLILVLCFIPGSEIPDVRVPFADKWTHFVLFAVFSFTWLCAFPSGSILSLTVVFVISAVTGWMVEELQGLLVTLGRSRDYRDIIADTAGGFFGVMLFYVLHRKANSER